MRHVKCLKTPTSAPRPVLSHATNLDCTVQRSRRSVLCTLGSTATMLLSVAVPGSVLAEASMPELTPVPADLIQKLEVRARTAYAERDFRAAIGALSELIFIQPQEPRWMEMRAAALVDGKNFAAAITDFNEALQLTTADDQLTAARLLAGRALAFEGEGSFERALDDYDNAQKVAVEAGQTYDPYILNSSGNCQASLERWEDARLSYQLSANTFQSSRGFRSLNGTSKDRQDGAVFATTNAALMLAQMGETPGAIKELQYVARRAGGNVDAKAALAALYYSEGRASDAENMWDYACNQISVGCSKYRDQDWLVTVRRWPPVMITKLDQFLSLRQQ